MTPREQARRRIIETLQGIIAEAEAVRADVDAWNESHPDEVPLDSGGDLCTAVLARRVLVMAEAGEHIPGELVARLLQQAVDNAANYARHRRRGSQ